MARTPTPSSRSSSSISSTDPGSHDISRKQYGRPNQEDLWSETRGYPACGTFYQGGHYMGGFRSAPDVVARSRLGNFTEFKEDQDPVATSPLVLQPDIDDLIVIRAIYPGRSLQIFTSSAELYFPDEPITPENAALKVTSRRGHQARTQPVDVQGGTFFVDRNGTAIREYLFSEAEQSYTAEPISTLGGHLVQQPVDIALRRSVDTTSRRSSMSSTKAGTATSTRFRPPRSRSIGRSRSRPWRGSPRSSASSVRWRPAKRARSPS
jgi:hypothetical protein